MYSPVLITPAETPPVSRAEAKLHLRVDSDDTSQDDVIDAFVLAALSHLEGPDGILGRCLVSQTWRQDFDDFASILRLPLRPISAISSVKYTDTDGQIQTVASQNYALRSDPSGFYVEFKLSYGFPALNADGAAVKVEFVAGYGAAADVPPALKQAIKLIVGAWYENREQTAIGVTVAALPRTVAVEALLDPYRRGTF